VTLVDAGGSHLAALVHDEALLEDPGLVSAVSAAVRLTVDNERLRLELHRRLDDLAASRSRIIAAGDDERRRIERDLHDGTQQRLVTIALRLRLAEARLPEGNSIDVRAALTQAVDDLAAVVAEVRDLARGIHPAILTESGLCPALESLADRSPIPVRTAIEVPVEPHEQVAATAYFCVAEALTNIAKHANATRVVLEARVEHSRLRIVVSDDGVGGARPLDGESRAGSGLSGLEDRVNASGGTLRVASPPGGGTSVEVELPCV
jgi:signal transduction histidine kinase